MKIEPTAVKVPTTEQTTITRVGMIPRFDLSIFCPKALTKFGSFLFVEVSLYWWKWKLEGTEDGTFEWDKEGCEEGIWEWAVVGRPVGRNDGCTEGI